MFLRGLFICCLCALSYAPAAEQEPARFGRCYEELSLGFVPVSCYQKGLTAEALAVVERRCVVALEDVQSLKNLLSLRDRLPSGSSCRKELKVRAEILVYKSEDKAPLEAFRYWMSESGTQIESQMPHVTTFSNQSD